MHRDTIAWQAESARRNTLSRAGFAPHRASRRSPAEDEQREPWIPVKYGAATAEDWIGVVAAAAVFERQPGAAPETLVLTVKVHPRQGAAHTLIPWIVREQHVALDSPYWEYRRAAEFEVPWDRNGPALPPIAAGPLVGERMKFLSCGCSASGRPMIRWFALSTVVET